MADAERRAVIVRHDLEALRPVTAATELPALMDKWLHYKRALVKPATYANFQLITENHIKPFFDGMPLGSLTEGDVQDFIIHLYSEGRKNGEGGFGVRSVRGMLVPLRLALEYAYKYNRSLDRLDWELLEYPKEPQTDRVRALTYEEQQRFMRAVYAKPTRKSAAYLMTLFTGLRIGEVCGLQMQDISLRQRTIRVGRTVQRVYHKAERRSSVVIGAPKTLHSARVIPFPAMLSPVIQPYLNGEGGDYFVTGRGSPCEPRTLRQCFKRFLLRNELPPMKYHELRHTFATRAVEIPGFDIKSLSAILGHNNPAFTLAVYGRANMEQEINCMELMNELF